MMWAVRLWDQPASTRSMIRNLALGGSAHADVFDLVRFIVESERLIEAGGKKTLIVITAGYHMCRPARVNEQYRIDQQLVWGQRGFYTIDSQGVIHRSGLNPVLKTIIRERAKITGLLKELVNIAYVPFKKVRVHDPRMHNDNWEAAMGPDWQSASG